MQVVTEANVSQIILVPSDAQGEVTAKGVEVFRNDKKYVIEAKREVIVSAGYAMNEGMKIVIAESVRKDNQFSQIIGVIWHRRFCYPTEIWHRHESRLAWRGRKRPGSSRNSCRFRAGP